MSIMRWKKKGLVWKPNGGAPWARTHGALPTPYRLNDHIIRVFLYCRDHEGRGYSNYVDVSAQDPTLVLGESKRPLLDLGIPGAFDDNGVLPTCIIRPDPNTLFMYYSGFELCKQVPYRIFTGLAISKDNGESFSRYSRVALLDRTDSEIYFRCSSYVMLDEGVFKHWYIAGSGWVTLKDKQMPVYDLRYQESEDGIHWGDQGAVSMAITDPDEHGFGRPWVVKRGPNDYQLFYSIRRRSFSAYRLGYAESTDGINWIRKDSEMGLDVTLGAFDSDAIMYSAVISVDGKTYCFYNGNNFGEHGFGVAELID